MLKRPNESEFAPFQKKYIDTVQDDVMSELKSQREELCNYIDSLNSEQLDYRYAEGKWSVKEVLMHIVDTERIFNYRALAIARGEKASLPGFDHEHYASNMHTDHLDKEYIFNYFNITRYSSLVLFQGFKDEVWDIVGEASNYKMSMRSFPFMLAGHLNHHYNILKDRYTIS